jgi:hypothetical protein
MPSPIHDSTSYELPPPEAYLTPEQRLAAVTEIITEIALRIITKRHESSSQDSNSA